MIDCGKSVNLCKPIKDIYHDVNEEWEITLRKKCPYSELFWSAFFPHFPAFWLNTESVFGLNAGKCGKNADQNNSEHGHFISSAMLCFVISFQLFSHNYQTLNIIIYLNLEGIVYLCYYGMNNLSLLNV